MTGTESNAHAAWITTTLDAFEGRLVAYASGMLTDVHRARDVVQETFLRLCRQERTAVEEHLAPWLYTVCRRLCLDEIRRNGRMTPTGMSTMGETLLDARPGAETDPAERAATRDQAGHALKMLETLPPKQREVIELKLRHGLKYREIAEVTGQSLGNVGFLIHHGMKTLRARLAPEARSAAGGTR